MVSQTLVRVLAYSAATAMVAIGLGIWVIYFSGYPMNPFELIESLFYMYFLRETPK